MEQTALRISKHKFLQISSVCPVVRLTLTTTITVKVLLLKMETISRARATRMVVVKAPMLKTTTRTSVVGTVDLARWVRMEMVKAEVLRTTCSNRVARF